MDKYINGKSNYKLKWLKINVCKWKDYQNIFILSLSTWNTSQDMRNNNYIKSFVFWFTLSLYMLKQILNQRWKKQNCWISKPDFQINKRFIFLGLEWKCVKCVKCLKCVKYVRRVKCAKCVKCTKRVIKRTKYVKCVKCVEWRYICPS